MIPVHHMRSTNNVQPININTTSNAAVEEAIIAATESPPLSSSSSASNASTAVARTMFALPRVNLKTSSTLGLTNSTDDAHHYPPQQHHNGHHHHQQQLRTHPEPKPNTSFEPATSVAHGRGAPPPQPPFAASLHYSTEKSAGSSGYYSSHIYSTSSFDEHIYSEPVSGTGSVGAAAAASRGIAGGGGGGGVVVVLDAALPSISTSTQIAAQIAPATTHASQSGRESSALHATTAAPLDLADVRRVPAVVAQQQQRHHHPLSHHLQHQQHQSAGLVNLESSIKNLELHLKAFSRPAAPAVAAGDGGGGGGFDEDDSSGSIDRKYDKRKSVRLPTIMEGIDGQLPPQMAHPTVVTSAPGASPRVAWQDLDLDDSLMDLDLDSFMMANELAAKPAPAIAKLTTADAPKSPFVVADAEAGQTGAALSFDDNKSIENNYKCRKYINSCPDDPYNIDEPIGGSSNNATAAVDPPPPPTFNKTTLAEYLHQCNDRVHYQSTRHILEEIRLKLSTLLGSSSSGGEGDAVNTLSSSAQPAVPMEAKSSSDVAASDDTLQHSIESLKGDLDNYLGIMNASNEMEIRQLCNGLANDHKLVTIQNALGNRSRRILCPDATCSNYVPPIDGSAAPVPSTAATATAASVSSYTEREETQFDTVYVRDGFSFGYKSKIPFRLDFSKTNQPVRPATSSSNTPSIAAHPDASHQATGHHHPMYGNTLPGQIKFKCSPCSSCEEMMNSNSSCEDEDDLEELTLSGEEYTTASTSDDAIRYHAHVGGQQRHHPPTTSRYPAAQLLQQQQRYPANVYDHRLLIDGAADELKVPISPFYRQQQQQQQMQQQLQQQHHQSADYHQNKPSIWEQYYGTNRMNHTFFKVIKAHHSIMSYPSERPESDFTLDLPQAEQLRLKMKREKQFRHRCRIVTSFLSLVFFLLTVVVVSLLLTRGKHPFGSMI